MSVPTERELERFNALLRRAVLAKPDPPRPAQLRELLGASYRSTGGKSLVGSGVLLLLGSLLFTDTNDWGRLVFAVAFVASGLFMIAVPALPARRAARALKEGVRVSGHVIDVSYHPPGAAKTIDAIKNGFAEGRRSVRHPTGAFEEGFESDASWAGQLRPGSTVQLLVDPVIQRVLLDLGPG